MPIYCYECPVCGGFEAEQSISDPPLEFHTCGARPKKVLAPVSFYIAPQHRAVSYAGREGDKRKNREYRTNKEAAEGLAKGTHFEPEGRTVAGDQQTRESVAQFNDMYSRAKNG